MPVTTTQQLSNYYNEFSETEVTFTKEVIAATRLTPGGVHLKCLGDQWPCVIYSSSMKSAKIIANLQPSLNETLRQANNVVSLRYSFSESDKAQPIAFFVKGKTTGFSPYGKEKPNLYLATILFSQRPPDDLIFVLGRLLEAKRNSKRRSEWRVPITPASVKTLGIVPEKSSAVVGDVEKRAILRDVSFSGCKAIVASEPQDLKGQQDTLHLFFLDPAEEFAIPAQSRRCDPVEGHQGISVIGFEFITDKIPMGYKLRINGAIRAHRKDPNE